MNEEEVQRIVREELRKTLSEDYFAMRRPGFNIESGTQTEGHGVSEFMVSTDKGQGLHFYRQGNAKLLGNKTVEVYGGYYQNNNEPGVVIEAVNGHIIIKALNGDLTLQGANIILEATDADGDVSINSKKIISMKSPEMFVDSTKATIASTSDILLAGGTLELYSETGAVTTGSGQDPILAPSLFDTVINITEKVKKILNRAG